MPDFEIRPGEIAAAPPAAFDAGVWFIGRIETPWADPADCPRRGDPEEGPDCRVVLAEPWVPALEGLAAGQRLLLLYWMHRARRDLVRQTPRRHGTAAGTFALRSPARPNPIAASAVRLLVVEGPTLRVRGLDCVTGTPLIDVKPDGAPRAP
jgi:tRNA-Thr(GGU) m(6)t(6)A37 methyltransferase TsaA